MSTVTRCQTPKRIKWQTATADAKARGIRRPHAGNSVAVIGPLGYRHTINLKRPLMVQLVVFATLMLGCERMDTVENTYRNFEAAITAGAVGDDKWIPPVLPPSAADIRETHNLETNKVWLSFHFSPAEFHFINQRCTPANQTEVNLARKRPGNWWPVSLVRGGGTTLADEAKHYQYYHCGKAAFLATNPARNVAYYWALR